MHKNGSFDSAPIEPNEVIELVLLNWVARRNLCARETNEIAYAKMADDVSDLLFVTIEV